MSRELLEVTVAGALSIVRVDKPDGWVALCPPFCGTRQHRLTDVVSDHADGPTYVMSPLGIGATDGIDLAMGLIVSAEHSQLTSGTERRPLIERLSPQLGKMTFTAIATADLGATYAEIYYNAPLETTHVRLPLTVLDNRILYLNAERLDPDTVDLALMCLQRGPLE